MSEPKFKLDLPEKIACMDLKLNLNTTNDEMGEMEFEIEDQGAGAFIRMKSENGIALDPEVFEPLAALLLDICKALEVHNQKAVK